MTLIVRYGTMMYNNHNSIGIVGAGANPDIKIFYDGIRKIISNN